jgi:hypothetical protein
MKEQYATLLQLSCDLKTRPDQAYLSLRLLSCPAFDNNIQPPFRIIFLLHQHPASLHPLSVSVFSLTHKSSNMEPPPPPPAKSPSVLMKECQYKTGKVLGAGSYSVVKECVRIDTGYFYAAKVINKRLMKGREHMVGLPTFILKMQFFATLESESLVKMRIRA